MENKTESPCSSLQIMIDNAVKVPFKLTGNDLLFKLCMVRCRPLAEVGSS
ncbi:hypothetical protein [Dyadobacter sp. CY356]|nr:hypothetical protein [Dyadobacter sp. CY356]